MLKVQPNTSFKNVQKPYTMKLYHYNHKHRDCKSAAHKADGLVNGRCEATTDILNYTNTEMKYDGKLLTPNTSCTECAF